MRSQRQAGRSSFLLGTLAVLAITIAVVLSACSPAAQSVPTQGVGTDSAAPRTDSAAPNTDSAARSTSEPPATDSAAPATSEPPDETSAPHLTIGFGFEDLQATEWEDVAQRLDAVGADGITLAVGRPEWTAFPWPGHEERWAAGVEAGDDVVADVLDQIATAADGREREVTLVIDTLMPQALEQNPELAGVSDDRDTSDAFPNATAAAGAVGEEIVALCGAVAERYQPDRIALTELILEHTYTDSDLEMFAEWAERDVDEGWPDHVDPLLGEWRASIITDLVARCGEAAGEWGTVVDMDVRANWDEPGGDRLESGHAYAALLDSGANLTVWNYFPLNDRSPEYSAEIAAGLAQRFTPEELDRVTLSVGLWTDGDDDSAGAATEGVLAPADLEAALTSSIEGGARRVSVTPHSMMTEAHWDTLPEWNAVQAG